MKRMILAILGVLMVGIMSLTPRPVMAQGECGSTFIGLKPWYDGICSGGEISDPPQDDAGLAQYIWTIALNIVFDLSVVIGYAAVVMVIYGGFMYMMAQGDPGKVAKGHKTLVSAVIGVVLAMGASVIVNTASAVLHINRSATSASDIQNASVNNEIISQALGWVYGMAGLVAVVFIIKNGFDFMVSQGDPGKVSKASRGMIFSAIGLVVVIAASIITSLLITTVDGAV